MTSIFLKVCLTLSFAYVFSGWVGTARIHKQILTSGVFGIRLFLHSQFHGTLGGKLNVRLRCLNNIRHRLKQREGCLKIPKRTRLDAKVDSVKVGIR